MFKRILRLFFKKEVSSCVNKECEHKHMKICYRPKGAGHNKYWIEFVCNYCGQPFGRTVNV